MKRERKKKVAIIDKERKKEKSQTYLQSITKRGRKKRVKHTYNYWWREKERKESNVLAIIDKERKKEKSQTYLQIIDRQTE